MEIGFSMKKILFAFSAMGIFFFSSLLFGEVSLVPLVKIQALGGQNYFEGKFGSFGGNASGIFSPGLRFGNRLTLLPAYTSAYRATREIQELVGGGFLTQQLWNHLFTLKPIVKIGSLRIKPKGSYKIEWIRETTEEKWGGGLFDFRKAAGGLEVEKEGSRFKSIRGGAEFYAIRFPNYKALTSRQFGEEIKSGTRVLDFNAIDGTAAIDVMLFPKSILSFQALTSFRFFPDQFIVTRSGAYSADLRQDFFLYGLLAWRQALPAFSKWRMATTVGLDFAFHHLSSSQNSYDATRRFFTPKYYDYNEPRFTPRVSFLFADKIGFSLSHEWSWRSYRDRILQDAQGEFSATAKRIDVRSRTLGFTLSYKILKSLSVVGQGSYRISKSNMAFEKVFRYNYSSFIYLMGLAWEL